MLLTLFWICSVPLLYVMYYSDFRNRFPEYKDIERFRVKAFFLAITGPVGLGAYVMTCLVILLVSIWNNCVESPFKVLPIHIPGRE